MIRQRVTLLTLATIISSLGLYYGLSWLMAAGLIVGILAFVLNDDDDDGNYPEYARKIRRDQLYAPAGAF